MKNIIKKIKIDDSLYVLLLIGMLSGYIKDIVMLFSIVLIHELGHVIFFTLFKIEIERIVIYVTGGICYVNKKINNRILYDFIINIAGIMMQVMLFVIIYLLWKNGYVIDSTYHMFKIYNISIILFNLLPIIPLDGSKLFFNICSKYFSFIVSYKLMIIVSIISLLLFVIFNVIVGINEIVICIFLLIQLFIVIKEYKYVKGKFYLERILYDNYYDEIVNGNCLVKNMKIGKYYFFYKDGRYYNEKDYLKLFK